jgi:hypothetical protein
VDVRLLSCSRFSSSRRTPADNSHSSAKRHSPVAKI